jgi:Ca2+/Na+ antiporter
MSRFLADERPGDSTDLNITLAPLAPLAVATGLILLIAAFATVPRMPGWAADYGASLVYFATFLYVAITGRLTWWGAYILINHGRKR